MEEVVDPIIISMVDVQWDKLKSYMNKNYLVTQISKEDSINSLFVIFDENTKKLSENGYVLSRLHEIERNCKTLIFIKGLKTIKTFENSELNYIKQLKSTNVDNLDIGFLRKEEPKINLEEKFSTKENVKKHLLKGQYKSILSTIDECKKSELRFFAFDHLFKENIERLEKIGWYKRKDSEIFDFDIKEVILKY